MKYWYVAMPWSLVLIFFVATFVMWRQDNR